MSKEVVQLFAKEEFSFAYMAQVAYDEREFNMWLDEIQVTLEGTGFDFIPKNGSVWGQNNGMKPDEFRDIFWDAHVRVVDLEMAENGDLPANERDLYPPDWFTRIWKAVMKRANHHCEWCGAPPNVGDFYGEPVKLLATHLNGDVTNNASENLAALCQGCFLKLKRQKKEVYHE